MVSTILAQLTPAETLYLLNHPSSKIKDLARLTFSDLLLKSVLKVEIRGQKDAGETVVPFVLRGKKFKDYHPLKHETLFTDFFTSDSAFALPMVELIEKTYQQIREINYKYSYLYSNRIATYFSQNLILRGIGIHVLNARGRVLQVEIREYFKNMNQQIATKQNYIEQIGQKLLPLRGNILLLQYVDASLFEALYKAQQAQEKEEEWYDFSLFYHVALEERKEFDPTEVMELVDEIFDGIGDGGNAFGGGDSDSNGSDGGGGSD
ncbi:MAG: hypothetical protein HC892_11935 [Saprospiraceae bacterium]|nr:hypothetical protein [Saprospiraceae bacterium]